MQSKPLLMKKIERTERAAFNLHVLHEYYLNGLDLPPETLELVKARVETHELAKTPEQRAKEKDDAWNSWLEIPQREAEEDERSSCPDCGAPENEIPLCRDCG